MKTKEIIQPKLDYRDYVNTGIRIRVYIYPSMDCSLTGTLEMKGNKLYLVTPDDRTEITNRKEIRVEPIQSNAA